MPCRSLSLRAPNWKSCDQALKHRGSLLIWRDKDMSWHGRKIGHDGRPPVFSDAAIQYCLMVKVPFGPPLLEATGMVEDIPSLARAGLLHPEPQAKAYHGSDPLPPGSRPAEPAGR